MGTGGFFRKFLWNKIANSPIHRYPPFQMVFAIYTTSTHIRVEGGGDREAWCGGLHLMSKMAHSQIVWLFWAPHITTWSERLANNTLASQVMISSQLSVSLSRMKLIEGYPSTYRCLTGLSKSPGKFLLYYPTRDLQRRLGLLKQAIT